MPPLMVQRFATRKNALRALILALLLIFGSSPLYAEEASITDIIVSVQKDELLLVARLQGCFTPKIESAILAGVPTTFTFIAELYEEHPFWFDRRMARITEVRTVKYDLLKEIFYITGGKSREPITFHHFAAAKRAMSEYNIVIPVSGEMKKGVIYHNYYVKMKAKLDKVRLPLQLEYVLFFVSLWDFETSWYRYPITFH